MFLEELRAALVDHCTGSVPELVKFSSMSILQSVENQF